MLRNDRLRPFCLEVQSPEEVVPEPKSSAETLTRVTSIFEPELDSRAVAVGVHPYRSHADFGAMRMRVPRLALRPDRSIGDEIVDRSLELSRMDSPHTADRTDRRRPRSAGSRRSGRLEQTVRIPQRSTDRTGSGRQPRVKLLDGEVEKLAEWTDVVTSELTVTERVWSHVDQGDRSGEVRRRLSRRTRLPSGEDLAAEGGHLCADEVIADDHEMGAVVVDPHEDRFVLVAAARRPRRPGR